MRELNKKLFNEILGWARFTIGDYVQMTYYPAYFKSDEVFKGIQKIEAVRLGAFSIENAEPDIDYCFLEDDGAHNCERTIWVSQQYLEGPFKISKDKNYKNSDYTFKDADKSLDAEEVLK